MKNIVKNLISIPSNIMSFFRSVIGEMKKTEFPTKKVSFGLANVVLTGSIVMSIILFGVDALFIFFRTYLTNNLK